MSNVVTAKSAKLAWLSQVFGVQFDAPGGDAGGLDPAEVRGRVNEIGIRLRDLKGQPGMAELTARFAEAVAAFRAGDLGGASTLLDEVEAGIAARASAGRAASVGVQGNGMSLRKAADASRKWREICLKAGTEIQALKESIIAELAADESYDEDDLDEARAQLDALDALPGKFDDDLVEQMDNLINADPEKRLAIRDAMLQSIADQLKKIEGDELLDALAGNGFRDVDLAGPARRVLTDMQQALAG